MRNEMALKHLKLAERHVAEGRRHIERQRRLIVEMERGGHDTTTASELLRIFEQIQAGHEADRDRILAELG